MGRKPRSEDDFLFAARFKYEEAMKIRDYCRENGIRYSDLIRTACNEFINRYSTKKEENTCR